MFEYLSSLILDLFLFLPSLLQCLFLDPSPHIYRHMFSGFLNRIVQIILVKYRLLSYLFSYRNLLLPVVPIALKLFNLFDPILVILI